MWYSLHCTAVFHFFLIKDGDDLSAHISQKKNEFIYLKDILFPRMAITLWSTKTPGAAQLERDIAVMNNKKKVSVGTPYIHIH